MFGWLSSGIQLALLLIFCIILVPILVVCIAGFFLTYEPNGRWRLGIRAKRVGDSGRRPRDIASDVRATIDNASQRLVQSAAEYKYVFPWMLTATDARGKIIFIRQYNFDSARRDGLRVEEIAGSPGTTVPRFPVDFRLVDGIGQDISWSMGVTGT